MIDQPGEPHVVRDDLEQPRPGRQRRRAPLTFFAHVSDTHVVWRSQKGSNVIAYGIGDAEKSKFTGGL